jgi:peptidoglycan/xylan/chitin deacetylase (PgdA/CDA1 family)
LPPQLDEILRSCRFVFPEGPAAEVLRAFLEEDVQRAQLSPLFRSYYRLRSMIPPSLRRLLQRYRPVPSDPGWYYPSRFASALESAVRSCANGITVIHPWPNDAHFAFVPTHDVETAEGMRNIERIANLEEDIGFRSSWNVVPHKYPVDIGLLRDLQRRGFEIGVHGYNHDGKLFTSRAVFDGRVPAIHRALKDFGAIGFRAPMVHRNLEWLQALDVEYDASYFDVDPYQAMPGGIGSVWPFIAGRFVELPYTLPQDHTLFIALGEATGRIWEEKIDYVAQLGGAALFITHPDYLTTDARLNAYRDLLLKAKSMHGMWHALPRQVAEWWRARDASHSQRGADEEWIIEGPAASVGRMASLCYTEADSVLPKLRWTEPPRRQTEPVLMESRASGAGALS